MKKTRLTALFLLICLCLAACAKEAPEGLWKDASYTEDATLGEGSTTIAVAVVAGDKTVTLTIKTDKTTLGDALKENGLIEGEEGEFGMYVEKVIGITADYDVDKSYWALSKDGERLNTGVDGETVTDGAHYELTYTK